ncbi:MAG: aromatic ring-hydroxylating oxygenase subunit alpha [Microthrixaceae bacterium]
MNEPGSPKSYGQPTLPACEYHGEAAHEKDLRGIFEASWLCIGPSWPVRDGGSFISEVTAGQPVIVTRDATGALAAFANVCAHRAGPLVEDDAHGSCHSLVCGYHGWSYHLDGSLRSARDSGLESDALDISLTTYAVAEWRGLVFVHLGANPTPFDDWLSPGFIEACEPFAMEDWAPAQRLDHDIAANWKTYSDNYLEGYHIPFVHPGLARAIDVGSYRVHTEASWARHHATSRDGSEATGAWLWHWPNLALNLYEHGGSIERWWPTGPSTCRLRLDFCFEDTSAEQMERNSHDIEASETICAEDKAICEVVQRNLESGSYERGVLSPHHEGALAAFQGLVSASVAEQD